MEVNDESVASTSQCTSACRQSDDTGLDWAQNKLSSFEKKKKLERSQNFGLLAYDTPDRIAESPDTEVVESSDTLQAEDVCRLKNTNCGETLHNKDNVIQGQLDVPLSSIGLEQAELLGKHLQQHKFTHVYSSDLSRAKQTAMSILQMNQVTVSPIAEDQRLRERKFGSVEGRSFCYLREASNKANQSVGSYTPPGAETLAQVRQRAVAFFNDLCQLLHGSSPADDRENLSPSKRKRGDDPPSPPLSPPPPPSASPPSAPPTFADDLIRASLNPGGNASPPSHAAPNVSLSPLAEQSPRKLSACGSDDAGDGGALLASVLVVSHGALLREMVRHLVEDLGCCVPGGRGQALRISPNAGLSKFTVSGSGERPRVVCHLIHDKQHLFGGGYGYGFGQGAAAGQDSRGRLQAVEAAGLSVDATAL